MIKVSGTVTVIATTTVPKCPESTQALLNILQSRNAHTQDALEVHTVGSFSCNLDYKLRMWVVTLQTQHTTSFQVFSIICKASVPTS